MNEEVAAPAHEARSQGERANARLDDRRPYALRERARRHAAGGRWGRGAQRRQPRRRRRGGDRSPSD
jgi:hypothetical protein